MSSYYERIKEAASSGRENITSLLWWLFGRSPEKVAVTAASGRTRLGSSLWRVLTRSPKLIRRGVQGVVIYAVSYIAEKFLDKAHEEFPDNQFVAKMDAVAHAAVKVENFLINGATSMVKDVYDSIPAEAAPPKIPASASISPPLLPSELTKAVTPENSKEAALVPTPDLIKAATETSNAAIIIPQVNVEDLQPPAGMPIPLTPPNTPVVAFTPVASTPTTQPTMREASFMPVETGQRNRANLNAALAVPIQPETTVPIVAPDGLPIDGGYDPVTEITWGPYAKPFGRPIVMNRSAPHMSLNFHHFPRR